MKRFMDKMVRGSLVLYDMFIVEFTRKSDRFSYKETVLNEIHYIDENN